VLYELLTGRLPFDGDDLPELCTAILTMPPVPLLSMRPTLPAALQTVLERCLQKECEARFQNVAELAQELAPFASMAGRVRVEHVVRVIEEGGEHVRPPTPVPGTAAMRAIQQAATLPASDGRSALTTGSSAASWGAVRPSKRAMWMRGPVLIPAVAALVVFGLAAMYGAFGQAPAPAPASAPVVQAATAPVAAPLPPPAAAAPTAEALEATPAAPSAAETAHHPARAGAGKRSAGAAGSAKKPAPVPSSYDSTAVINPFD
jgi:eukaryotic-like serine/threonine-protein kinase